MTLWTANSRFTCGWTMDDDCAPCRDKFPWGNDEPTPEQAALFQDCVNSAAEILYALSGRQFGACEVALRPCRRDCCDPCGSAGMSWTPLNLGSGEWTNIRCNSCGDSCSCTNVCEVSLPGPIESITQVKLNGEVLDSSAYRVDNGNSLVALKRSIDGGDPVSFCWPTCQDMNRATDQPNTWGVTYLRGMPVPSAGRRALAELACELCLACLGDSCCALPKRVTSLNVDGASMAMLDPMTFIDKGLVGLYAVDLWLRSVNPKALSRGAAILSPDMVQHRRTNRLNPGSR